MRLYVNMNNKTKILQSLKRFIPYYKPYINIFTLDMLCAAVVTLVELVFPLFVRLIMNDGLNVEIGVDMDIVLKAGLTILFLRLVDVGCNYYIASAGHVMGAKMETDMREKLYNHLQKLSFSYYDNTKIGQLMSRITNDLFEITEFAHHCPEEFFIAGFKIIGSFIILSTISLQVTLIIFAFLPFMLIFSFIYNKKMQGAFKRQREQIGEINANVEDSLAGIRVVKSFANEALEDKKFQKTSGKFLNIKKESYHYMGVFHSGIRFFDGIMYLSVVVVGSLFIKKGIITMADLVTYLLYIGTLLNSISRIVQFTEQLQRGLTGFQRYLEIIDTPIEIVDKPDAITLETVKGEVCFNNVTFRYSENLKDVLSNINLSVKKGENVAIVGPSGSGKTTLCSLIPRFYEVTSGNITIDGIDIKDIEQASLRSNIGVVQQDVYLFAGTIRENIAYGKPDATFDDIIEAAKQAGAHEFIIDMDKGYDTYVGERGVKLSGGQKQRISIARVFLKNPPILILDEATSSLDNESEKIVQRSLEKLSVGRTTFIIAHRLTTIRNASVILVLTENGIEESGSHSELIKKNGIYSGLYELYNT
ncbi:MAG: transporter ATP-binding protein [Clostridia bacterium]|nr:transporter ATP-binding protein [Clostridia bacterium]